MSDSEQEMFLKLASIRTLQEAYKAGVLKAVKSPKYPLKPALLDRVSLWSVTPSVDGPERSMTVDLVQARRHHDPQN